MPKLSAVRKVPETITFQALGIIETLGSIISPGTSKKFHDLVLSLRSQNSRVPETIVFQALFSQRKVSVFF